MGILIDTIAIIIILVFMGVLVYGGYLVKELDYD